MSSSILLPTNPGVRTATPRLLDFGVTTRPPLGGAITRYNRLGNRFEIDVVAPTSSNRDIGPLLISRLMQGMTQGVLLPFPQDMDIGEPGDKIVVNGAAQQGSSLNLRGFPPGYTVKEGQFFSLIYGGRRYLDCAAGTITADGGGGLLLPIVPMLRISPNDGAVCEFAEPMIEGFMSGQALEWQIQQAPFMDVKFTVTEAE